MIAGYRAIRGEVLVLLIALAIILVGSQVACAAGAQLEIVSSPPMTVSPSYGEHQGLVAAMNAAGETKLAWDTEHRRRPQRSSCRYLPGWGEAGLVTTMSSGRPPRLSTGAGARAGRSHGDRLVRRKSDGTGPGEENTRPPGPRSVSRWRLGTARTVWHMAPRSTYTDAGLAVANDDAGDEAVAWLTRREGHRARTGRYWSQVVWAVERSQSPPCLPRTRPQCHPLSPSTPRVK